MVSVSPQRKSLEPPLGRSAERLYDQHQRSGSLNNSRMLGHLKTMGETSNSSLYNTVEKRSPKPKMILRGGLSPSPRDSKLMDARANSTVGNSPTKQLEN